MVRLSVLPLLLCLLTPSPVIADLSSKEVEVNGVRLQYTEQGSGEVIIFVHGGLGDLRTFEPIRQEISKKEGLANKYRYIALTQRYYGTGPWPDGGKNFSVATHARDLAKFISALNAGPVHLVGYSYGGAVAATAAIEYPSLVRSLILYEPALISVLPAESEDGKAAREDRARFAGSADIAARSGDLVGAARLFIEGVFQLPPGGFDRLPQATQTRVLDNARVTPLMLEAIRQLTMECETLKQFSQPALIMQGEKTQKYYVLINRAVSKCLPRAQQVVLPNVNHNGLRDPAAFTTAIFEFLSKR